MNGMKLLNPKNNFVSKYFFNKRIETLITSAPLGASKFSDALIMARHQEVLWVSPGVDLYFPDDTWLTHKQAVDAIYFYYIGLIAANRAQLLSFISVVAEAKKFNRNLSFEAALLRELKNADSIEKIASYILYYYNKLWTTKEIRSKCESIVLEHLYNVSQEAGARIKAKNFCIPHNDQVKFMHCAVNDVVAATAAENGYEACKDLHEFLEQISPNYLMRKLQKTLGVPH